MRDRDEVSSDDVKRVTGLSQSTLSRIERGLSAIQLPALVWIARQLDLTPGELLGRCDEVARRANREGIQVVPEIHRRPVYMEIGIVTVLDLVREVLDDKV